MSDLRYAKAQMNAQVHADLESVAIFDPAALDACPPNALAPFPFMLTEKALELDDGRACVVGGRLGPCAPWEVLP